ncbi:hypothetical protein HWV62_20430 [Athelia sp. TMB]|nr:hypothetical protein HWV62_20430 [Athelia sp. TMB]
MRLEGQLKAMQSRIKELESALGSQASDENVRSSLQQGSASLDHAGLYTFEPQENDDIDEVADAVDALSIGAGGQARYHGLTTSSEVSILEQVCLNTLNKRLCRPYKDLSNLLYASPSPLP